jgi:DNA-binding MarR family transcriptional regulator
MHVIDDFNSILIKELDFILDVVSKSPDLFLIVVEEDTWSDALKKNVELSKHFYPIYLSPLSLEDLKMLVLLRLHVARMDDEIPLPFTDDAIQILVTYAFRNPGILINLCKKSLLNAISEGITRLDKGFVKRTIHEKTGFKNFATYLSQRQIEILEAIISEGGETDFNTLEERVGISRVAINEHLKDLFEMEIVEEADSPTKKKIFRVTKKFKAMIA